MPPKGASAVPTIPRRRPRDPLDLEETKRKSADPARSIEQPSMGTDVLLDSSFTSIMVLVELVENSMNRDIATMYNPQREIDRLVAKKAESATVAATAAAAKESTATAAVPAPTLALDLNPELTARENEEDLLAAIQSALGHGTVPPPPTLHHPYVPVKHEPAAKPDPAHDATEGLVFESDND